MDAGVNRCNEGICAGGRGDKGICHEGSVTGSGDLAQGDALAAVAAFAGLHLRHVVAGGHVTVGRVGRVVTVCHGGGRHGAVGSRGHGHGECIGRQQAAHHHQGGGEQGGQRGSFFVA